MVDVYFLQYLVTISAILFSKSPATSWTSFIVLSAFGILYYNYETLQQDNYMLTLLAYHGGYFVDKPPDIWVNRQIYRQSWTADEKCQESVRLPLVFLSPVLYMKIQIYKSDSLSILVPLNRDFVAVTKVTRA